MSRLTLEQKAEITINKGKESIPAITKTLGCLSNKDLRAYMTMEQGLQIRDSIILLKDLLSNLEDDFIFEDLKVCK